jgi:hypothetical protein
MYMKEVAVRFDNLYQAFSEVWYGNSMSHTAGFQSCNWQIPDTHIPDLPAINKALGDLTPDELEAFCYGDEAEANLISFRLPALRQAHELLGTFFEEGGPY